MGRNPIDITGERYGYLVAVRRTEDKRCGSYLWECRCVCGNTKLIPLYRYRTGRYKSCGCMEIISKCKKVVYQGKRYTAGDFAKLVGLSKTWICERLNQGFSTDEIARGVTKHRKDYGFGKPITATELAKVAGVTRQAISARLQRGWKPDPLLLCYANMEVNNGKKQV